MAKIEGKKLIVDQLKQNIEAANLVVFADYRGLTVAEMTELRKKLRQPGVEFKVVKNTMVGFALQQTGHEDIIDGISGPNAVVFSNEDPVGPAKALFEFAKTHKSFQIKVGLLEGKTIAAEKIKDLAELPSKEVLVATLLGTMQAPITSFVRVLNANITGFVRALDQVREQKAS